MCPNTALVASLLVSLASASVRDSIGPPRALGYTALRRLPSVPHSSRGAAFFAAFLIAPGSAAA